MTSTDALWIRPPTLPGDGMMRGGAPAETDWQHYFGAVRRRKWLVLAITVVGTALGLVASRLLRPPYSATALLWFETKEAASDPRATDADELLNPSGWIDLVESNAVLEEVVRQRRLFLRPRNPADSSVLAGLRLDGTLAPGRYRYVVDGAGKTFRLAANGRTVQTDSVTTPVGNGLGFTWVPDAALLGPGGSVEFELNTPAEAARELRKTLTVTTDVDPTLWHTGTNANFLRVRLAGAAPVDLAATVNAIGDRVVLVAADLKRIKLVELGRILDEQRQHALRTLRDAEAAQRDFRVRSAGVLRRSAPPVSATLRGGDDPAFDRSFDTKLALDSVQRDRQALERALAQMKDSGEGGGAPVEALQAIGAVQKSAELSLALTELNQKQATLRALRYRYTDQSEPVQRVRVEVETLERTTVPTLARGLDADLAAREQQLGQRTDAAFGYLRDLPPLALEEARLQRDVTIAEQLFTTVQQSYNQTQLAAVSSLPDVRILDRAPVPERPDRNLTPLLGCASFVLSFGLAVFSAVMMDGLNRKVRYPEHVTRHMRLSILGAVPRFDWRHLGNGKSAEAAAPVVEALRGLRLRLSHAGGAGPLLVTVTSPGVGEGKSFLSCNLALAFADAGFRTLLIDGDVRRGAQHRMLGLHREPGLVDFLAGDFPLETVLQQTRHTGLSFIGCGVRRPSAPELLSSDVMSDLMDRVRTECGVVLVDSPPLAVGVDPYVLATRTGNVLIVLRAGVSDLEMAGAKLDVLDTLPVRVLGAVLNDVQPYGAYRYYTYDAAAYAQGNGDAARRSSGARGVLWGRS